ncbi:DUF3253 domain-containing protein [Aquabacter sediminis]|uniref:DUF3253 domain-containing protein n=1 Tax=Aquabacter sediminis TaxID=3029197 RepID=UPI00237E79A9|nr:DUF3253 domain-containing protein [Aquabacter sp. P-9]MDE1566660.1 DUF3253 domain-containing protein [Aquabacter sp. P-9]
MPDADTSRAPLPAEDEVSRTLLALAAESGETGTISPTQVAQALLPPDQWQRALPLVRRVAVALAREGRLMIFRKGKPVDPEEFRGVYRLGLPRND